MVRYTVSLHSPKAHLFSIEVAFTAKAPGASLLLRLPRWISGSYLMREFAAQIQEEKAYVNGFLANIEKTGLASWRIRSRHISSGARVLVTYFVWAFDSSVRTAFLDASRGFFNPGALLMAVCGQERDPVEVRLLPGNASEAASWRIATGLPQTQKSNRFGLYGALNYPALLDSPFCLGHYEQQTFRVNGTAHTIVVTNAPKGFDFKRLVHDVRKICAAQIAFFSPREHRAPMDHYTFFLHATQDQFGGLEHNFSAVLAAPTKCLPRIGKTMRRKDYIDLLSLFSHEYFHAWNVKRVTAREFVDIDYSEERPTRLLWFFEGFTSYYESLFLVRTNLITTQEYLDLLGETLRSVLSTRAQEVQSLSASSFDAWIKLYRPTANSVNSTVSYYRQGALAALVIDSVIRKESCGKKSLDDTMRQILSYSICTGNPGIRKADIVRALNDVCHKDLHALLEDLTESTSRPDYALALAPYGIRLVPERLCTERRVLGLSTRREGSQVIVTRVYAEESGEQLGISPGDILCFIGRDKVTAKRWSALLKPFSEGASICVRVKREGRVLTLRGTIGKAACCVSRARLEALTKEGRLWLQGSSSLAEPSDATQI